MRILLHVLIGAIAGFSLGILGPIAMGAFMWWTNPKAMEQGGGGPLPFLMILTAPLAAIYGAAWGYGRVNPPKTIIKRGPEQVLADFDRAFANRSLEDQRIASAEIMPAWMAEYRRWINGRLVLIAVMSFLFLRSMGGIVLWLVVCGGYTARTFVMLMRIRSVVQTVRERLGDDAVDRLGLHWTLRLGNQHPPTMP